MDTENKNKCIYTFNQPGEWDTECGGSYENWGLLNDMKLDIEKCVFCGLPIEEKRRL